MSEAKFLPAVCQEIQLHAKISLRHAQLIFALRKKLFDLLIIRILARGRINLAAVEEIGFRYMYKQLDIHDKFEVVYIISEKPFYTVFPKKMGEKGAVMAEKFGNTLRQMREEGIIRQILNEYR